MIKTSATLAIHPIHNVKIKVLFYTQEYSLQNRLRIPLSLNFAKKKVYFFNPKCKVRRYEIVDLGLGILDGSAPYN